CWPLVQRQDIGLWIREWWFESTGANGAVPALREASDHSPTFTREGRPVSLSRAELLDLFDEITTILESDGSAREKIERIEAAMFEPAQVEEENESDDEELDGQLEQSSLEQPLDCRPAGPPPATSSHLQQIDMQADIV